MAGFGLEVDGGLGLGLGLVGVDIQADIGVEFQVGIAVAQVDFMVEAVGFMAEGQPDMAVVATVDSWVFRFHLAALLMNQRFPGDRRAWGQAHGFRFFLRLLACLLA